MWGRLELEVLGGKDCGAWDTHQDVCLLYGLCHLEIWAGRREEGPQGQPGHPAIFSEDQARTLAAAKVPVEKIKNTGGTAEDSGKHHHPGQ